jgi:hypothetical protein
MANFNLEDYETVEDRLVKFWKTYPEGRVETQLINRDDTSFIFTANIYRTSALEELPFSQGWAHEVIGVGMVNKTSALENCETSAIGRALANGGFATKGKRASREEMSKVQRGEVKTAPKKQVEQGEAEAAFVAIAMAENTDQLKSLWKGYSHLLDEVQDNVTLRQFILNRKETM